MTELLLRRPDDSGEYDSTLVLINDEAGYKTDSLYPSHYRRANSPMIEAIKVWLKKKLNISRRNIYNRGRTTTRGYYSPTEVKIAPMEFRHKLIIGDDNFTVYFYKQKTRYYIDGLMANKEVLIAALARTIFKSCFTDDPEELKGFMLKHIQLPEMVSYALENRAPYFFNMDIEKHGTLQSINVNVRLKVRLIGSSKVALELSDGIWGEMTVKQMNTYMNCFHKNKKQSKWGTLCPSELWNKLMREECTSSDLALMLAFLQQNRTDKVVKERARDLMIDLTRRFPKRIKINWGNKEKLLDVKGNDPTIMYINGNIADWKLTDRGLKSQGQQNVSTFVWSDGNWAGPICVDNLDNKSPTGDQFVTRAMGLLNDNLLVKRVSTIRGRLNSKHVLGQTDQRISLFQQE
tara:strand:- start:1023 stop:2237 length:1215 start_codon:yes stop_codon:yes gene_type:complete